MSFLTIRLQQPQTPANDLAAGGSAPVVFATIDQLLVEAAIQHPEADALRGDFGSMIYADLLIRAQNVAVVLKRQGIGPGHFVGVAMEQSPATIAAIVGVLFAGAAYVPIAPTPSRMDVLNAAMREAEVSLVLWDASADASSWFHSREFRNGMEMLLDLSRMEQETMPSSTEIQLAALAPDAAAARFLHLAEDSGPVTVSHRSIARLVSSTRIMQIRAEETFLLHAIAPGRDALFELWGSLLHGATLVLAPSGHIKERRDPVAFAAWVARRQVSVLALPVTRVHEAIDQAPLLFSRLRTLILENDGSHSAISPSRVAWLQQEYPRLHLVQVYATPKTAGYATAYRVPPHYQPQAGLPIGLALEGSQARIVDDQLSPVRNGEMGQLALSGDCVAIATTSTGNQSSAVPGNNLYLTGERAWMRTDGFLELHGSLEPQLVREHRSRFFDPADIEAMLAGHKHVREVVVVAGPDRNGRQQMVAYVVVDREGGLAGLPFEETLKGMLPPAAVPAAVCFVDALPRDTSGNVDRDALRLRWKKESESTVSETFQRETLQQIRAIWLRLLRNDVIGYEEDFYAAGGTQVQMIRMHAELNRKFPGAISMGQLSVLTTIRKIYEHLLARAVDARPGAYARRGA